MGGEQSGMIEIFFTVEPIVDAVLRRSDLPNPTIKILPEPHLQNDAERTIR